MPSGESTKKASPRKKVTEQVEQVLESNATPVEPVTATAPKRKPRTASDRTKRRAVALPVLIVDETVLLPHMSIPFPIEDDESAMVIDRAARMPMRQVLVLTERIVKNPTDDAPDSGEFRELFADVSSEEHLLGIPTEAFNESSPAATRPGEDHA